MKFRYVCARCGAAEMRHGSPKLMPRRGPTVRRCRVRSCRGELKYAPLPAMEAKGDG